MTTPRRRGSGAVDLFDVNCAHDRYGFRIPAELLDDYMNWRELRVHENEKRRREYAAILSSLHEPYFDLHAATLFRQGLPPDSRRAMWLQASGVGETLVRNAGLYESLLNARGDNEESNSARNQIELDVVRTFRNNRHMDGRKEARLRNVLRCYARHNRRVGYAQSMSLLAMVFLLLDFSDEEAFWMLDFVIGLMPDCYDRELSGTRADIEVLGYYVSKKLPELHNFFLRNGIPIEIYATPMFMCLYVGYVPYETLFRLWDRIMFNGVIELFKGALKFLHYLENEIYKVDGRDIDVIINHLLALHVSLVDADAALAVLPGKAKMEHGQVQLRRMRRRAENRKTQQRLRPRPVLSPATPVSSLPRANSSSLRRGISARAATIAISEFAGLAIETAEDLSSTSTSSSSTTTETESSEEEAAAPPTPAERQRPASSMMQRAQALRERAQQTTIRDVKDMDVSDSE